MHTYLYVVNFENLNDIVLIGHSYGGMVISGVAEQIPERINRLVYLDAFVPNDGESDGDNHSPYLQNNEFLPDLCFC